MLDVFLCHSKASRSVAETIAGRLELCAEAKVWREETNSSSTLIDVWEGGLSSAAIVLVLDPDAVPRHATRDAWEPILNHVSRHTDPPIGCVRLGSAACPRLLERTNFHEWQNEPLPVLRALDEWIISLHTPPVANTFEPARLPWFESRNTELNQLWHDLVDSGGATLTVVSAEACGKTALAQEFARRASSHFRDIVWIGCGERSAASILGELADQLGTQEPEKIPQLLAEHRLLVILDDLRGALP